MQRIRASLKGLIRRLGYDITKALPPVWASDEDFGNLYDQISGQTVVAKDRCFMLYQMCHQVATLRGDVAEVGVFRGGSAKLLAKTCPVKTVHLFDTFTGLPAADLKQDLQEFSDSHSFSGTSVEAVRAYLSDCQNVVIYEGLFPDTAERLESERFCLVHVDTDLYRPVMDCLEFFYPRMVQGGVLVFDDYDWQMTPGVKQAVHDFLADKFEMPIISTRNQCLVFKR